MSDVSVAKVLRSGMAWNLLSVLATQGAGFVIFLVLASRLSPGVFGVVAIAAIMADFFANEGRNAGMDAILQSKAYDRRSLSSAFWGLMGIAVLFAIAMTASAPLISRIQAEPLIAYFMPVFGLSLMFIPWICVMDALIMKDMGFRTFAVRNMLSTLIGGAAGIACAFSPWTIWALVVQRVTSVLVIFVFELISTGWVPWFVIDWARLRDVLGRFLPMWAVASLIYLTNRMTVFVFGLRYSGETVGLFRAADRINESVVSPLVSPLFSLWFPMMTKVRGDIEKEREIYQSIIRTSAFMTLPALCGMIVVAEDLVGLLLPESYAGVTGLIRSICITALLIPIAWFNGIAMNALNMNRKAFFFTLVSTGLCLLALLLAGNVEAETAVLIIAAPGIILGPAGGFILHQRLGISNRKHYLSLLPAALAALLMGIGVWFVRDLLVGLHVAPIARVAICVPVGAAIYFGWLFLFHKRWLFERIALLKGRGAS